MTISRCEGGRGPLFPRPLPPGGRGPALLALLLAAAPASAQELTLPSGLPASLYDVVLEAAGAAMAPDAFTDPESLPEEPLDEEEPMDRPLAGAAAPADAAAGGLARFRLVVPGLGAKGAGFEAVAADFAWLCKEVALPALAANGWAPTEVVVALSDRETEFGALDPAAVQFFEGFRIADGTCVPQAF